MCVQCAFAESGDSEVGSRRTPDPQVPPYQVDPASPPEPPPVQPPDPDNPHWGPAAGLGTWAFSIAAAIVVPLVPLLLIMAGKMANGASPESIGVWAGSPSAMLVLTIATLPAQALTLLFCWAIVTRLGKLPFLESLGWHWAGRSVLYWSLVSLGVVASIMIASNFLLRWLPDRPSPFEEMLRSSPSVRIATVVLAIVGAPLVEEIVYRGVLYSGLRKRLSGTAAVLGVTVIFVAVHVPQYLGAWRSIAGLTLLSLALTIVRARTSSVLPSFLIHLLNNAIASAAIMFLEND